MIPSNDSPIQHRFAYRLSKSERGASVRCPLAPVNGSASLGRGRCQAGLVIVDWYWRETELGSAEWR
jgi:hypothetical protein